MPQNITIPDPFDYDDTWMLYVLVAIIAMFVAAYWVERLRRRQDWKRTLETEYAALSDLARDKDLSKDEQAILEDLARRFAPEEPFRVGTMREVFNRCVDAAMDEATQRNDPTLFERRGEVLRDIRVKLALDYVPFGLRIRSTRELYNQQPAWVATSPDHDHQLWTRMVVSIVNEGFFYLEHADSVPMPTARVGDTIHFRLWREEDARYEFNAKLAALQSDPQGWKLAHSSRLRRLQARAHYRIKFDYACEVGVVNAPVDGNMEGIGERPVVTRLRGRVTSLSGGGYAVVLTQPVPKQVVLRIVFELPSEQGPLITNARIVGTVNVPGGRHLLRCSLVGITEEEREVITRYIFQTQQANTSSSGGSTVASASPTRYED